MFIEDFLFQEEKLLKKSVIERTVLQHRILCKII